MKFPTRSSVRRSCRGWIAYLSTIALIGSAAAQEPLTVESLFANPTFAAPSISTDGKQLAFFHYEGEDLYLFLQKLPNGTPKPLFGLNLPGYVFGQIEWANHDRLFVSAHHKNQNATKIKDRDTRLFGLNTDGSYVGWLGRYWPGHWGVRSRYRVVSEDTVLHSLPNDPNHVSIQYRRPFTTHPAVYNMDIYDGRLEEVTQRPTSPVTTWFVDGDGIARAAYGRRGIQLFILARADSSSELTTLVSARPSEEYAPRFLGFSQDPDIVYVTALHEGREAAYEYSIRNSKQVGVLFAHPQFDIKSLVYDRSGKNLLGIRYVQDYQQLHPVHKEFGHHYEKIRSLIANERAEIEFIDLDLAEPNWLLRVQGPAMPPEYLLYSLADTRLSRFHVPRPALAKREFSPTRKFHYQARDGQEMHGYITLPDRSGNKPLPAVVLAHGEPIGWSYSRWNRATLSWNPKVQLLASRGLAVIQVNFRGSSGFGIDHETSGYQQYGILARRDISDALEFLVKRKLVDPKRIGIFGSELGGYLALVSPIIEPRVYAAAASHNGLSDIENFLDFDDWYRWYFPVARRVLGEKTREVRMDVYSPLRRAKGMPVPVLLTHGSEAWRIPVSQSRKMAKALTKWKKEVTYHEFDGHSEVFHSQQARLRYYTMLADFFVEHLKP